MSIEIYLPKPHEGQIAAWTAAIPQACANRYAETLSGT